MYRAVTGLVVFCLMQAAWSQSSTAQGGGSEKIASELSKQESIYRTKGAVVPEGYITDRTLADYTEMLATGFERALAKLGPNDRWLDIGAGQGRAILDYVRADASRSPSKAKAVAISIEDRRTPLWKATASSLGPGQLKYLVDKHLREYSLEDIGQFELITDVIGGFSYSNDLSLFVEKVTGFLTLNGSFYTVLPDARWEDGKNRPYYADSPFSTAITDARGSESSVCTWLKSISCVEVSCEPKEGWKPPIQAFRIRKTCNAVTVPALVLVNFEASTPPGRQYRASLPAN